MSADELPTIFELMPRVSADVGAVAKNLKNEKAGYAARSIDDVLDAVHPAVTKHGVFVMPMLEESNYEVVEVGKNRTPMRQVTIKVRFRFYGPRGDYVDAVLGGEALDSGDKATNKGQSAALKYAWIQALTLPVAQPDADAFSHERSAAPAEEPQWKRLGWDSDAQMAEAHDEYTAQASALGEDDKTALKDYRRKHRYPWPMTAEQLADLTEMATQLVAAKASA